MNDLIKDKIELHFAKFNFNQLSDTEVENHIIPNILREYDEAEKLKNFVLALCDFNGHNIVYTVTNYVFSGTPGITAIPYTDKIKTIQVSIPEYIKHIIMHPYDGRIGIAEYVALAYSDVINNTHYISIQLQLYDQNVFNDFIKNIHKTFPTLLATESSALKTTKIQGIYYVCQVIIKIPEYINNL